MMLERGEIGVDRKHEVAALPCAVKYGKNADNCLPITKISARYGP